MVPPLLGSLAALSSLVVQQNNPSCIVNFGNSTFNLGFLTLSSGSFSVQDSRNLQGSTNYTYYFNICNNVGRLPSPACNTTYPGSGYPQSLTGPAPAFQLANYAVPAADQCHRLGTDVSGGANMQWGMYDSSNPSRGVYLQYTNGDLCTCATLPCNKRSLRIWLLCYNDPGNIPDTEMVLESSDCSYDIYVQSLYGCPVECPAPMNALGEPQLCSNHGVCDYDSSAGSSRCFCNDGYTGRDCGSLVPPPATGLSGTGVVLVAVSVFLAMTLAFLAYLWLKIRGLRLDPTAYSALRSGPSDGPEDIKASTSTAIEM